MTADIVAIVTAHYHGSADFNGMSVGECANTVGVSVEELAALLVPLVRDGLLGVLSVGDDVNVHILRLGFPSVEHQVERLAEADSHQTCIYPTALHLSQVVPEDACQESPYTRQLMLGAPQLAFRTFDLSVLETYRNDPRYTYWSSDLAGRISISDEHYESTGMKESDKVLLSDFGYAYNPEGDRAAAAYLRYLANLSPEHQQIWRAREVEGFKLHPEFYRMTILGEWPERVPIIDAILEELHVINQMAEAIGRNPLFRESYRDGRPDGLGLLLRPTRKEYYDFVLILDKLLSDNMDKSFFRDDVPDETEEQRKDGKVVIRKRGTIAMLEDWLTTYFHPEDEEPVLKAVASLKRIRKLRQVPAHKLNDNAFDQKYVHEQRDLLHDAFGAVRTIRMALENHPGADQVKVPDHLRYGRVWDR